MTLQERDYERGPSIYPADQLLEFLEKQRTDIGEIVLRLPVQCTLKPNRMYLKTATVGDQPDALAIKVNDTSLGVPISAKMQQLCEGQMTCMLWLRGVWRGGPDKEFQVSKVDGLVEEAVKSEATFVEVAKR